MVFNVALVYWPRPAKGYYTSQRVLVIQPRSVTVEQKKWTNNLVRCKSIWLISWSTSHCVAQCAKAPAHFHVDKNSYCVRCIRCCHTIIWHELLGVIPISQHHCNTGNTVGYAWWRDQMETGTLCLNKRLSKQSWGWWFETPSRPLWRHCNVYYINRSSCKRKTFIIFLTTGSPKFCPHRWVAGVWYEEFAISWHCYNVRIATVVTTQNSVIRYRVFLRVRWKLI